MRWNTSEWNSSSCADTEQRLGPDSPRSPCIAASNKPPVDFSSEGLWWKSSAPISTLLASNSITLPGKHCGIVQGQSELQLLNLRVRKPLHTQLSFYGYIRKGRLLTPPAKSVWRRRSMQYFSVSGLRNFTKYIFLENYSNMEQCREDQFAPNGVSAAKGWKSFHFLRFWWCLTCWTCLSCSYDTSIRRMAPHCCGSCFLDRRGGDNHTPSLVWFVFCFWREPHEGDLWARSCPNHVFSGVYGHR